MRIRLVYHRSDGSFCDLQLRDDAQFYVLSDAENAGIEFALIKDGEIFAEILRISACADDRLPPPWVLLPLLENGLCCVLLLIISLIHFIMFL